MNKEIYDNKPTININLGQLTSSLANKNDDKRKTMTTFDTLDKLNNYLKMKPSTRSYSLYILQDRYSILYSTNVQPGCEYTTMTYDIIDIVNDRGMYTYTTSALSSSNEEACLSYLSVLRQLVAMNGPINLALLHVTHAYVMCEFPGQILAINRLSKKNSRDVIFQVIFTLLCMYSCDAYIDGIHISLISSGDPVNLVFNFGQLRFELSDVLIIPIIRPIVHSFKIYNKRSPLRILQKSYSNCARILSKLVSDDQCVPSISNDLINECLFSFLVSEYHNESNVCTFEPMTDDNRIANKYISRACLLAYVDRGNVFRDDDDNTVIIHVGTSSRGNTYCFNVSTGILEDKPIVNLTRMIPVKETLRPTFKPATHPIVRSFTFNGI